MISYKFEDMIFYAREHSEKEFLEYYKGRDIMIVAYIFEKAYGKSLTSNILKGYGF